jgi:hypothetical protein
MRAWLARQARLRIKLVLVALLGILRAGWYAIPKARLFDELHGSSGIAVAVSDVAGLVGRRCPSRSGCWRPGSAWLR